MRINSPWIKTGIDAARSCVITLLITLGLLLVIEGGFRVFWHLPFDQKTYRLTQPPAYKNSPFWSKQFIEESFFQPNGWDTPKGKTFIYPNDYEGTFFHVKDRKRITTNAPKNPTRHVYMFGGSTMYNSEVPDQYTIPSYLQRLLNAQNKGWAVVNMGSTSVNTTQQLERLRETKIQKGDLVIFYDGVNDIHQGVLYGDIKGTITTHVVEVRDTALGRLREKLKMFYLFQYIISHPAMIGADEIATVTKTENVQATKDLYFKNIDAAQKLVTQQGGEFVHFLQPSLNTLKNPGDSEQELLAANDGRSTPLIMASMRAGYEALHSGYQNGKRKSYDHDISDAFDGIDGNIYLDHCHVTEKGNEAIAKRVFSVIAP